MERPPDQATAQFGEGGPVAVANAWIHAVLEDHNLRAVWPLATPGLRRKAVDSWIAANTSHPLLAGQDQDQLADELSSAAPDHPLWPGFEETQLNGFAEAWSNVDLKTWGWASDPRPLTVDRELVLLCDAGGGGEAVTLAEDTVVPAIGLVMEHTASGWRVADFRGEDDLLPETLPS